MSRELAIRYQQIVKEMKELDEKRWKHMRACDLIHKKKVKLQEEIDKIKPEVYAWQDKTLRELGVK